MSNAGYTDRPYAAGRGALICMYVFGAPAVSMLGFQAIAAASMGSISGLWRSGPLRVMAVTMIVMFLAAAASMLVAIMKAYSIDGPMTAKPDLGGDDRPIGRNNGPAADPWAQSDVAATDRAELAGVTP